MRPFVLEDLLGELYATDPSQPSLDGFLGMLGRVMGSHMLGVQIYDPAAPRQAYVESFLGITPELESCYESVAAENVWFIRGGDRLAALGFLDDEGLVQRQELQRTRFHADFLRPADLGHGMALCLDRHQNGRLATLTINRSQQRGYYDNDERQLAATLLPHVRNAYALHSRLRQVNSMQHSYRVALDGMDEGVFFLAANRTIVFTNEQAQCIEADGSLVRREQGRLAAVWRRDDPKLQLVLANSVSPSFAGGTQTLRLHDRDGRPAGAMTICQTPPAALSAWSESHVAAMVFVKVSSTILRHGADRLRIAWGLTRAEARLAALLLQGFTLEAAARQSGVSKNTVRSQLRGLFDKTGAHRQAELVSLLLQAS